MRIVFLSDAFTTGVVAGAFVMGTFGMRSAAAALDPGSQLVLRQRLIGRLSRIMPILNALLDRGNGCRARFLRATPRSHLGESPVETDCTKRAGIWTLASHAGPND